MQERSLARSGITVSTLGLGTMRLGGAGGPGGASTPAGTLMQRVQIVHRALDAGVTLIGTSVAPGHGDAPEVLARALRGGRRDDVILAVTVPEAPRGQAGAITAAVEEAMRRLDTDWIDLVLLHRSWIGDIDGALGALSELVRSEEVGLIGTSGVPLSTLVEAQWVARQRFFKRFVAAEIPYSMLDREAESELLPTCRRYRIASLASRPLGGGWLWGDLRRGASSPPVPFDLARVENQRRLRQAEELAALAAEAGLTLAQMALAFVLGRRGVATAMVGPRTLEQLEGLLPAAELELDSGLVERIEELTGGPPAW